MRRKNKRGNPQKSRSESSNSGRNSVSLNTTQPKVSEMFLGYRLKNANQLWRWDTLEDVIFK